MKIITNRFLLRDFTVEDEAAWLTYHADPRYAEFCGPVEVNQNQARELLHRFIQWAGERPRLNYQFAVTYRHHPQGLVGCCGLRTQDSERNKAELGIELAPQYWGHYRYAIEIGGALLQFGFCELGLQEVQGFTISANSRVNRLAHRYGFVMLHSHPGPAWMQKQGWRQVEWLLTWERWNTIVAREQLSLGPKGQDANQQT